MVLSKGNQPLTKHCICMFVCSPLSIYLFFLCWHMFRPTLTAYIWHVIEIKTLLFNAIQYSDTVLQGYQMNCCWTHLSDTDTARHLLNVSHQLVDSTHGSAHYTLHSNSYIATAADCLATAAKMLGGGGVSWGVSDDTISVHKCLLRFFFWMLFRSIWSSLMGLFSLSRPQISAPSLTWRWPETAQMSAANWATQMPAGCLGIPPPYARPGTPRNSPPSCLTRKEGAWDAWQTGAPGWAARSTGHASHPRAVPIPTVVTTPVRTAPWRRCPWA